MDKFPKSISLWGKHYCIKIIPAAKCKVTLDRRTVNVHLNAPINRYRFTRLISQWYKEQCTIVAADRIKIWSDAMGVTPSCWHITQSDHRWGAVNPALNSISLNRWLAQHPQKYLDMIIIYQLAHFCEPHHNERFFDIVSQHCPDWKNLYYQLGKPVVFLWR